MLAQQINQMISMRDIVEKYNIQVNGAGCIVCPFHKEKTPSLKIYSEIGKGYFCFGCHSGGDVIKFVMLLFNINFKQALLRLTSDFGLSGYSDSSDMRDWQRRQAEAARIKRKQDIQEYVELQEDATRAIELRHEIRLNEMVLRWFEPFSLMWCDAINKRDKLNYDLEVIMIGDYFTG